jgi:hypothetical protein
MGKIKVYLSKGISPVTTIIIIAVIGILTTAGILVYIYLWHPVEPQTQQNSNNSETADWKTYRNEELGFEFKYPENWVIEKTSNYISFCSTKYLDANECVILRTYDNPSNLSLRDFVGNNAEELMINLEDSFGEQEKIINGRSVFYFEEPAIGTLSNYFISANQRILHFQASDYEYETDKVCEKIISIFKFFPVNK